MAGAVLISILTPACSRREPSPALAALESAYQSGILTENEYLAKKSAIQAQAARLAALERAMQAGLLSQDEYLAKKTALLAPNAPVPASADVPDATVVPSATAVPDAGGAPIAAPPQPAAIVPTSPSAAADPQGHTYRMKVANIIDAHGFEHPMTSVSLLIPVDWQSQGETTWNTKDVCNSNQTHVLATGPDGRAFEQFPAFNWEWADDPQLMQMAAQQRARFGMHACDVLPPVSAQEYLRRNLSKLRPNAQLVGFEPAPKLLEGMQQEAQQIEQVARQYNLKEQVKADAIKARVKYTVDGKPMEEWISAATLIGGTLGPGWNLQTRQPEQRWSYKCVVYTAAERAPQGQLDASAKLFEVIASTYRTNPEWQARVTQTALAMQEADSKGVRDRSAIIAKSAEDTRNIQRQIYENRQKAEDRNSTQFSQYIRGVETYQNPSTGETVDLDNNYGHAWVNNRGEYLLSDQAGFDPNAAPGEHAELDAAPTREEIDMKTTMQIALAVALTLSAAACHKDNKEAQLKALDSAYKSGVFTKEEYDAKKQALMGTPAAAPAAPAPAPAAPPDASALAAEVLPSAAPAPSSAPAQGWDVGSSSAAPQAPAPPAQTAPAARQPAQTRAAVPSPAPAARVPAAPPPRPSPPQAVPPQAAPAQAAPAPAAEAEEPEPTPLAGCQDAESKAGGPKGVQERFFPASEEAVRRAASVALTGLDFTIHRDSGHEMEASKRRHLSAVIGAGGERLILHFSQVRRGGQSGTWVTGETKKSIVGRLAQKSWTSAVLAQIACNLRR